MELEQKVVEVIEQLQGLAEPAADLAMQTLHTAAIIGLVRGAALIGLAVIAGFICRNFALKAEAKPRYEGEAEGFVALASGVVCAVLAIVGLGSLASTKLWLALFNPAAALAYRIIGG